MENLFSDILSTVQFKSALYFKHGFCSPWGMDIKKGKHAQFHLVTNGNCMIIFEGKKTNLQRGDIAIFPNGATHQIKDSLASICQPGKAIVEEVINGKAAFSTKEISTQLICGHYEIDREVSHPIFNNLPEFIIIQSSDYGRFDLIYSIFELISEELSLKRAGFQTVSLRLAEILFITIIRHYYIKSPDTALNLFKDTMVYNAIELIHSELASDWTIENLARNVGVSRTLFINRFKQAVGETPIKYLTNWRMTKAKYLLKNTSMTISQVGEEIGYSSEPSFVRVFKNQFAITPGKFRLSTKHI